ncbi:MAG TPA: hypothetical protein PKL92_08405 [Aquaticitalea sp.]|nr:hypothetical protein [Aquaticitalea sp.]
MKINSKHGMLLALQGIGFILWVIKSTFDFLKVEKYSSIQKYPSNID